MNKGKLTLTDYIILTVIMGLVAVGSVLITLHS
jgi:hypothetical protein